MASPNCYIVSSESHRPLLCIGKYCSHKPWAEKNLLTWSYFQERSWFCVKSPIRHRSSIYSRGCFINIRVALILHRFYGFLKAHGTTLCKKFMIRISKTNSDFWWMLVPNAIANTQKFLNAKKKKQHSECKEYFGI